MHTLQVLDTVDIYTPNSLSDLSQTALMEGKSLMQVAEENIRTSLHDISADYQKNYSGSFADFVESVMTDNAKTDYITKRTVISFNNVRKVASEATFESDERNIRNWLAIMIRKGTSPVTLRRYLGKLHTLYTDYSGADERGEALFGSLREMISDSTLVSEPVDKEIISKIKSIPSRLVKMSDDKKSVAKALLFLLYMGGAPYSTAYELRFTDQIPDIDQVRDIVESMPAERRTYVFPFRHGSMRPTQLYREMSAKFARLLSDIGMKVDGLVSAEMIRGWWIELAIDCGINCEEIVSVLPSITSAYSWLRIANPLTLSEEDKLDILRVVSNSICDTTPRWYAMFMRDNNTPDDIKAALSESCIAKNSIQFFYPTHKVLRQQGGKKIREDVAFIPRVLFFRTRPDAVKTLFETIGDLAWCFRTVNTSDAPYAIISNREMANFQRIIGVLDESSRVEFVQNPNLLPDKRVRITGGAFCGYEGTIYRQNGKAEDSDMRYFVLRINDLNNIVWQVKIEESFIELVG